MNKKLLNTALFIIILLFFTNCMKMRVICVKTTETPEYIGATEITVKGEIIDLGEDGIIEHGHCWSTSPNPTIDNAKTQLGATTQTGFFSSALTELSSLTNYYIRAYATDNQTTVYGDEITVSTLNPALLPTVTTSDVTDIAQTTATAGGNVTSDGGATIIQRGVCFSTSQNPTTVNSIVTASGTTGSFSCAVSGLTDNTTYYVRAYATNSQGTSYGSQVSFTTLDITTPTVTTAAVTNISFTTATAGGNVTSDGGATIIQRGVCFSTSQNPTTANNIVTATGTTGSFTCNLSGLTDNTTYYVRAYAINSQGTSYGSQVSFTTLVNYVAYDGDGNGYTSVVIGTQEWLVENLKTTKYNDGSDIPNVTDNTAWTELSTPAYCWYNNDYSTYGTVYGALYNWWVTDATSNGGKNVCPVGWHVPTDNDWYILENYVDPTINDPNATGWRGTDCGTKLKAVSGWNSGGNGTDNYGFAALPGGYRNYNYGSFYNVGGSGNWWSSSQYYADNAWDRILFYDGANANRYDNDKENGFSLRCVQD